MHRFRKKPVVVEAWKWNGKQSTKGSPTWVAYAFHSKCLTWIMDGRSVAFILIETLEGSMEARPGDWIIRGIKGELYPCKPDIFEETYEPVEEGK